MKLAACGGVLLLVFLLIPSAGAQDSTHMLRNVVIDAGEQAGDVTCIGCSVRVRGAFRGDIVTIGGGIEIEGTITGDAVAVGGSIRVRPGARVEGDALAIGGIVRRDADAAVSGNMVSVPWFYLPGQRQIYLRGALSLAGSHLALFLLFYVVLRRRRAENMAAKFAGRPVWSFVLGLGIVAGVTLLFWASEYLGRWEDVADYAIAALLGATYAAGSVGLSYWLGRKLLPNIGPFWAALAGSIVIFLVELVPVAGFVWSSVVFTCSAGVAVWSAFGGARRSAPQGA